MARRTYGPLAVFAAGGPGQPDEVIENATGGIFSATLNGPALPIYDFNDQPIASISSSPTGQAQWRAEQAGLSGFVKFGSISVAVTANDIGEIVADVEESAAAAAAAQADAAEALTRVGQVETQIGQGSTGLLALTRMPAGYTHSITLTAAKAVVSRAAITTRSDIVIRVYGGTATSDWENPWLLDGVDYWDLIPVA